MGVWFYLAAAVSTVWCGFEACRIVCRTDWLLSIVVGLAFTNILVDHLLSALKALS